MPLTQEQFQKARSAGFSTEQIIGFEKRRALEQPQPSQPTPSVATQGASYITQHPYKTALEPLAKTITGKSLTERSQSTNLPVKFTGNKWLDYPQVAMAGLGGLQRDVGANAIDMATTPANYIPLPLGKIPAVNKVLNTPIKNIGRNIGNAFNLDKKALDIATKVRQGASQAKTTAVEKFGLSQEQLAKADPNTMVDLSEAIDSINQNIVDMAPEAKSVFKKVPILKDLLKNPQSRKDISLSDSQKIINYMNTKIPREIKANHLDVMDVLNDVKAAQLDAFPEMSKVRADYGNFKNDYNLVKSALKPGRTVSAIRSDFSGNPEIQAAAKRIFTPEVLKEMAKQRGQVRNVAFIKSILKKVGAGAALTLGGETVYQGYKALH